MKYFTNHLCLLFLFFFCQNGIAQSSIKFDENGIEAAVKRSKKENKPIFYMIYADWCPHCNKMKKEVFTDPAVADFFNANFVCSWQNVEKGDGEAIKKRFDVKSYPTFIFLDKNQTILYNLTGEFKVADLISEAKNALDPEKQLPYLEKQFSSDPGNVDKCLAYILTLRKGKGRTEISAPAHQYLATQTDEQLVSDKNWRVISNAVTDIKSREFQYVLSHQTAFSNLTSPLRVEKKIVSIVSELLKPYTENLDSIQYFKQRAIAKSINLPKTDSLIFNFDVTLAKRTENWIFYKKTTIESVEKYCWNDPKMLKEIGQNYLKHISDVADLKYAIKWTQRSLDLNESYDGNLLMAKLYQKINDRKLAVQFAQKAKSFSESLGFDTKEAKDLLLEFGAK